MKIGICDDNIKELEQYPGRKKEKYLYCILHYTYGNHARRLWG